MMNYKEQRKVDKMQIDFFVAEMVTMRWDGILMTDLLQDKLIREVHWIEENGCERKHYARYHQIITGQAREVRVLALIRGVSLLDVIDDILHSRSWLAGDAI